MSILVNRRSRVITQGIHGDAGRFHTLMCREYGQGRKCFVAGVSHEAHATGAADALEGMPIFGSVKEAKVHTGATVSVIHLPSPLAAAAIEDAVEAELELVICIADGLSVQDLLRVRHCLQGSKTLLLGPSCQGVITPDDINIGTMPSHIHRKGRIGVLSCSSKLTTEAARQLANVGLGQSTVVGIGNGIGGGHAAQGLRHVDVLRMFNDDAGTDAVLLIGEIGNDAHESAHESCLRWVQEHMHKPVVAFVAAGGKGTAHAQQALMEECGIRVTRNPAEMCELLEAMVPSQWLPFD